MNRRRDWRFADGVLLVVLVGLALVVSRTIAWDIGTLALSDEENSYIILAPLIVVLLVWVRRERLRYCRPRWTVVGPGISAIGWLLAAFGYQNGTDIAWHFGGLMMVFGAAVTIIGLDFVRQFIPACLALLFFLPVPGRIRQQIAIPLQESSARITHYLLEALGAPILREGNMLQINGYDVAVAEACNGMRMVSALGLVTFAFVFSVPMRQPVRLAFLVLSPVVALLVNVIRLVPTVMLYGYADIKMASMFHDVSGWAMLAVALVILWISLLLLRWLEIPVAPYAIGED